MFDAVWYQPEHKAEALGLCRRLTPDQIAARGRDPNLHGLGFAYTGILLHEAREAKEQPRGSLVYFPDLGTHGLDGNSICLECDWQPIKPGLWGGAFKADSLASEAWAKRANERAAVEKLENEKRLAGNAERYAEEFAHLAACTERYLMLCERFAKRGKLGKKFLKRVIGAEPMPSGAIVHRAFARLNGERAPLATDPEAYAASSIAAGVGTKQTTIDARTGKARTTERKAWIGKPPKQRTA